MDPALLSRSDPRLTGSLASASKHAPRWANRPPASDCALSGPGGHPSDSVDEGGPAIAAPGSEDADMAARVHTVTTALTGETGDAIASIPGVMRRVWRRLFGRCGKAACWWGATAGALPHVLHFMGPLAGTAFVTGGGGTLLFAGIGLVVATPLLWYEYRHTGGWRAPVLFLAASAALFMLSTFVLGDLLRSFSPEQPGPAGMDPHLQH